VSGEEVEGVVDDAGVSDGTGVEDSVNGVVLSAAAVVVVVACVVVGGKIGDKTELTALPAALVMLPIMPERPPAGSVVAAAVDVVVVVTRFWSCPSNRPRRPRLSIAPLR